MSFVIFLPIVALLGTTLADCFFPNGTQGDYLPCNENAQNSACCAVGDACLSNGFCFQQANSTASWAMRIARGQCTDWTSDACPQKCKDVSTNTTVTVFMVDDAPDGLFCCMPFYDSTSNQCSFETEGSNAPFSLPLGQIIYDRATGATVGTFNETSSVAATVTATITPDSNTTAVAASIAVPLGILLLCALAAVGLLWRRLKRAKQSSTGHAQGFSLNTQANSHRLYQDDLVDVNNGAEMHKQRYSAVWQQQRSLHPAELTAQTPIHELDYSL